MPCINFVVTLVVFGAASWATNSGPVRAADAGYARGRARPSPSGRIRAPRRSFGCHRTRYRRSLDAVRPSESAHRGSKSRAGPAAAHGRGRVASPTHGPTAQDAAAGGRSAGQRRRGPRRISGDKRAGSGLHRLGHGPTGDHASASATAAADRARSPHGGGRAALESPRSAVRTFLPFTAVARSALHSARSSGERADPNSSERTGRSGAP